MKIEGYLVGFSEIGVCLDSALEQSERTYFACLCTCINICLCECCVTMSMCL